MKPDVPPLSALLTRIDSNPGEQGLPPVNDWHPSVIVPVQLSIDRQGRWYADGEAFQRTNLVRLFSTLLRREADAAYYVVTPTEKARVSVADVPFIVVDAERDEQQGQSVIRLTTHVNDVFCLDAEHPLWVVEDAQGQPCPYARVRDRLDARLLPKVFYQLVDWAEPRTRDGETEWLLSSCGQQFSLGRYPETD